MIKVKDIKAGTVFWESDMGMYIKCQALTDAIEVDEQYKKGYQFRAVLLQGDASMADEEGVIEYFEAFECYGYGLKLYAEHEVGYFYG